MTTPYQSYAFTIRPKNGQLPVNDAYIINYVKNNWSFGFIWAEKEDEARHIHAQVWSDEPRFKGNLTSRLKKLQSRYDPDWSPASAKVLAMGVKIAYSAHFTESYSQKPDAVLLYNSPPEEENNYYPSIEEQNKVQEKANAPDTRLHSLYELYQEWEHKEPLPSIQNIALFLSWATFTARKIRFTLNARDRQQLAQGLRCYIIGSGGISLFLTKEDAENIDLYVPGKV